MCGQTASRPDSHGLARGQAPVASPAGEAGTLGVSASLPV
jgi:hypothetical protein